MRETLYIVLGVFLVVSIGVVPSNAETKPNKKRKYSRFFSGAFVEPSLRGSWTRSHDGNYSGFQLDGGLRHSFPMYIGDLRLAYTFQSLEPTESNVSGSLEQHNVNLHLGVHPLYLLILGKSWTSQVLSAMYFEIGIGGSLGTLSVNDEFYTEPGYTWSTGLGFDFPLTDPNVGESLWLNTLYRVQFDDKHYEEIDRSRELTLHSVFVGLAWRYNGLLF